ncbi:Hsp20 family protein [Sphingomonas ginkgonis]|uniref:Hsp20 family protein n=1 Tax=Sphingomonas ginkgonis TaxID=2315330 RepID=A0A3R9WPS2_9SPHN|nr:Hsp20 family protein [Sphingomonas ginkgonis]RST30466.1 Hsp20 family protein [Sphingomonas ginkgonis]
MRTAFDFAPFRRSTVGFDRLFDMLENSAQGGNGENYPPFDLIKLDDNRYRIEIAVAGFKRGEIDITSHQNQLIVRGQKAEDNGANYVHRGIATRSFERRFALADHIQVTGADLHDGMLSLDLVREIPEAMKPRKIEIGGAAGQPAPAQPQTIDAKAEQREPEPA